MRTGFVAIVFSIFVLGLYGCGGSGGNGGGQAGYTLDVISQYGIPNPAVGTHTYNFVAEVTASVDSPVFAPGVPGVCYFCTGWVGTGSVPASGSGNSVSFTLTRPSSISWVWVARYKLTVSVNPVGTGAVARSPEGQWCEPGSEVSLSATPGIGFSFESWSGDPVANPDEPDTPETVLITMSSPKSVVANFAGAATTYRLTVSSSYGNPDPPVGDHNAAAAALVTASVDEFFDLGTGTRYRCTGYTGTGDCPSGSGISSVFTITQDSSITWNWQREYRLITSVLPGGAGRVARAPDSSWYADGATVELTAEPALGFSFFNWSQDLIASDNPVSFSMDGFKRVTANFTGSGTFYTLTISSLYGYPDPPAGTYNLLPGTEVTVSVGSPVEISGTRYTCTGWISGSGNIPSSGAVTSYTFTITRNSAITWDWTLSFSLTVNIAPAGAGTVTKDPDQAWYDPDTIVTLTATAASGYTFRSWSGDLSGSASSQLIVMNGPKIVNANFSVPSTRTWVQRGLTGGAVSRPSARHSHSVAFDINRQVMVVFGGNAGFAYSDETWEWNGAQWSRIDVPGTKPSPRYGHSLAYDFARGVIVLFGGYDGENYFNDTWEYDGARWTLKSTTNKPTARYYAAMTYDPVRRQVVLFGGNRYDATRSNDTWVYDGTNWQEKAPASRPTARNASAMVFDPLRNVVVLHGGQVESGSPYGNSSSDTWEWDGSNWISKGTTGPSISWHSMTYDAYRNVLVLFGGWEGGYNGTRKNETWERAGENWAKKTPARKPAEREKHTVAYDLVRGETVLFGGLGSIAALNDTWVWNGTNWRDAISNPLPTSGHTISYDSNRRADVLFGGIDGTTATPTNATWEWYDGAWSQAQPSSSPPSARERHSAAYDVARSVTVIFGGCDNFGQPMNDTWTWDGSAWSRKSPSTSPPARYSHAAAYDSARNVVVIFGGYGIPKAGDPLTYLGDTWEWNGTNWTEKAQGAGPPARFMHAMAYDSFRQRVVLYAGYSSGIDLDDTWEWNGTSWSQVGVIGPPARSGHAMAYDSARRVIVLFGGSAGLPLDFFHDTWQYNGTTWTLIDTGFVYPAPRHLHAMCYDAYRSMTVLFGGFDGLLYLDDTWEY